MATKKGDKRVCLRDRLLSEKAKIAERNAAIDQQLKTMDKDAEIKWVNARIRECKVIAKQASDSRIVSETHEKQLADIWGKVYRHDLSSSMVARAVENTGKPKQSKALTTILSDSSGETQEELVGKPDKTRETLRDILD